MQNDSAFVLFAHADLKHFGGSGMRTTLAALLYRPGGLQERARQQRI